MQAPKNGFFYVINAASGEFISGNAFGPVTWATGLDDNGRPIETEDARYGKNPVELLPGPHGAHNWHPMAYNPELELAYIPAQEIPFIFAEDRLFNNGPTTWNIGTSDADFIPPVISRADLKAARATLKGRLIAWDPKTQQARWSVEHPNAWNGGVLSTAGGLVWLARRRGRAARLHCVDTDAAARHGAPLRLGWWQCVGCARASCPIAVALFRPHAAW